MVFFAGIINFVINTDVRYSITVCKMKKILLILIACSGLASCCENEDKYATLILGIWELKDAEIEIKGAPENMYQVIKETMKEKAALVGDTFEFRTGNIFIYGGGEGKYYLDGRKLELHIGDEHMNLTVQSLNNRSLLMTYDAKTEQPAILEIAPALTKCMITFSASKKKN